MKRHFFSTALIAILSGCATPGYDSEGVRATEAMTDMDGVPISPGSSTSGIGIGIGIGGWGHRGGAGVGFGMGF
ncbi:MAG: hypothetical protein JWQ21_572 [Herminiimonas sp.]|nr:hypothetical protein [Herminiimonas sp.]